MKLNYYQKEALAFSVMSAAVNMVLSNTENDTWFDETGLGELAATDEGQAAIHEQLAVWMKRLPGTVWHMDLPNPNAVWTGK
jgi:hypothetical protein